MYILDIEIEYYFTLRIIYIFFIKIIVPGLKQRAACGGTRVILKPKHVNCLMNLYISRQFNAY